MTFTKNCQVDSVATWLSKTIRLERGHTARAEGSTLIIEGGHLAPQTKISYQGQIEFALGLIVGGETLPSLSEDELWTLID
jgi:hypothetical protein